MTVECKHTPLYPVSQIRKKYELQVSNLHKIYIEEHGSASGRPVVVLHGGPGGAINREVTQYFDPNKWRVILFDQRGCGKSTPFASLEENTTWDLVSDIEKIREMLGIDRWAVFGGSWGSTLGLAYGVTHPDRCELLILRGIFLGRKRDIYWLYQDGASSIYPDAWDRFLAPISVNDRGDLVAAYYDALTSNNKNIQLVAAKAWSVWEGSICQLVPKQSTIDDFSVDKFALAFARIECHYFFNQCFFLSDDYIISNISKLENIPGYIVHGRYDVVCPAIQAWQLHKAWKGSKLTFIDNAGHSLSESGISQQILAWTEQL
ncbi:MAG: prolyl aminopeptidase [Bdellovibrionota bacterium]